MENKDQEAALQTPPDSENEIKLKKVAQELTETARKAGYLQYNIYDAQNTLSDLNIKMRNLIIDQNKLSEVIEKEKAPTLVKAPEEVSA